MSISVKPLDKMFRNAGLNTDRLLEQVRRGYSGQGGALSPITYAPDALNTVDPTVDRANNILAHSTNSISIVLQLKKRPLICR